VVEKTAAELERRRRRNRIIVVTVLSLTVALTAAQVLIHQLRFPSPIASNLLIIALVNINIVLLLLLVLLVFRDLFKVYLERRENVLGSKFRVKLAVAFVSLALLPAGLLFLVASNLITTSVDSWFNIKVEESLDKALEVAQAYTRRTQEGTLSRARHMAARLGEGLAGGETIVTGPFRALRHADFRRFLTGQGISLVGTWMQSIAQGWLVLELTGSAFAVGITATLATLPVLFFTLYGGVVADRVDRRRFIMFLQAVMLVEAAVMAGLTLTHYITVEWIWGLAVLFGIATAFEVPTRQAFLVELVPPEDLISAAAINSTTYNLARVIGPAIAGVVVAAGGVSGTSGCGDAAGWG